MCNIVSNFMKKREITGKTIPKRAPVLESSRPCPQLANLAWFMASFQDIILMCSPLPVRFNIIGSISSYVIILSSSFIKSYIHMFFTSRIFWSFQGNANSTNGGSWHLSRQVPARVAQWRWPQGARRSPGWWQTPSIRIECPNFCRNFTYFVENIP